MRLPYFLLCCFFLASVLSFPKVALGQPSFDVVVYGGNASGVMAAVAAARQGSAVALLEPGRHLGGMVSGGLGATDAGRAQSIGGVTREFFERLGQHYGQLGMTFWHEPHVAEEILRQMTSEAGVKVFYEHRLREKVGVEKVGARITALVAENGARFVASVFVDASYEADVMAQAKVSHHVGRESRAMYNEPLAGVRGFSLHGPPEIAHDDKGLLPDISTFAPGREGEGDAKVQAYNFRLCLTKDEANRVPIGPPENYDPRRYALLSRITLAKPEAGIRSFFSIAPLPNGKTDFNNIGSLSTDLLNGSWRYPEGSYEERARIWHDHRSYIQGLLYFLGNDSSVPGSLRAEVSAYGFAADEFTDTAHWPHQLYIREARRMQGAYVMTQRDIQENITKPDSIGMGSYMLDCHYVQRVLTDEGLMAEGHLHGDNRVLPYEISYRSLTPRKSECENLLVPVGFSASHVAYSSMRMEPVYMIAGHSAGVAAFLAARSTLAVQDVDYALLKEKLLQDGQVLSYILAGRIDPATLPGFVVEETEAQTTGLWLKSTSGDPFVGRGYMHDNNTRKGERTATFTPDLPQAGRYEVWMYFSHTANRASNVPVTVNSEEGAQTFIVNQKVSPAGDKPGYLLGTFSFAAGRAGSVVISNENTDGVVVADAVQFVPVAAAKETMADIATARRHVRDLVRRAQLPDGAIRMNAEGDTVLIVPYFSNIAALGLLAAYSDEPDAGDLERVRNWLLWYARHQEPDGTINDYSGTVASYARTEKRDSTDSYAATFLQVLRRYHQATGGQTLPAELQNAAVAALRAIELTFEADGLTWAKPEYRVKYWMDNVEVNLGLLEGHRLFAATGAIEAAQKSAALLARSQIGLREFWLPEEGHFAWAKGSSGNMHTGFSRWYPEALANVFACIYLDRLPSPAVWEKIKREFSNEPQLTPDWWARAANRVGGAEEKAAYLQKAIQFALEMDSKTHKINRFGTTLLALSGDESRWSTAMTHFDTSAR